MLKKVREEPMPEPRSVHEHVFAEQDLVGRHGHGPAHGTGAR